MSAPFPVEDLRTLQAQWDAEAEAQGEAGVPAMMDEAALRLFACRTERIMMPILLGTAATLGAVCVIAQVVKWIGA